MLAGLEYTLKIPLLCLLFVVLDYFSVLILYLKSLGFASFTVVDLSHFLCDRLHEFVAFLGDLREDEM